MEELEALAWGLDVNYYNFKACIVNGVRYNTESRKMSLKTQNSGVYVLKEHNGRMITFYGVLSKVMHLNYMGSRHVFLFKCR